MSSIDGRERTGNPEHAPVADVVELVLSRTQNPRTENHVARRHYCRPPPQWRSEQVATPDGDAMTDPHFQSTNSWPPRNDSGTSPVARWRSSRGGRQVLGSRSRPVRSRSCAPRTSPRRAGGLRVRSNPSASRRRDSRSRPAGEVGDDDYRRVSTHDLRRCWANHLLVEEAVSPRIVMALGGWSSYDAIEPYLAAPTEENINSTMSSVDP